MKIVLFVQAFVIYTAVSLIAVFFMANAAGSKIDYVFELIQFETLALAFAIISAYLYPIIIGVRRGEKVLLITTDPVSNKMIISIVTALENARIHKKIKIKMSNGNTLEGFVESYCGIISPARISMKPEQNIKVI